MAASPSENPPKSTSNPRPANAATRTVSGPLPSPAALAAYEAASPGSAKKIIKMAEDQAEHRRMLEEAMITKGLVNERLGVILGFTLFLILILTGGYLILKDKPVGGLTALLIGVIGPLIAFFRSQAKTASEGEPEMPPKD